jgi:uncharacterized protein (TIGR02594 family)
MFDCFKKKTIEPKVGDKDYLAPYKWAKNEMETYDTAEIAGKLNNPRIVWYHSHTSLKANDDETPWCASFVCAALENTRFKSTRSAAAVSYEKYGEKGDGSLGDIVVFRWDNGKHHIGFVSAPYKYGDRTIQILGGNQKNRVCVEQYESRHILAIRRPA